MIERKRAIQILLKVEKQDWRGGGMVQKGEPRKCNKDNNQATVLQIHKTGIERRNGTKGRTGEMRQ